VARKNNFKALPIFGVLVVLSVLSFVIFQSYPTNTSINESDGEVFGLNDENIPFPIHPQGQILSESTTDGRSYYTIKSTSTIESTKQWYNTKLKEEGWTAKNDFLYERGAERLELSILEGEENETLLLINYIY